MKPMKRRDFLKSSLVGLGALGVGSWISACSPEKGPAGNNTPIPSAALSGTEVPQINTPDIPSATRTVSGDSFSGAYLAVARGGDDPEALTRKAVAAVGGMQRFVPNGASVVIKPNMCVPRPFETGATTNPLVVAALVKMCLEAGAKQVKVLDYPFGGPSDAVYESCGIAEKVREAGGLMEVISRVKFVKTAIPDAKRLKETEIYDEVLKADVLINVPVAKNHTMAQYTLGMKNLLGVIQNRGVIHGSFAECIPDLNTKVRSTLTVVDAVRIMMQHGPTGGSPDDIKKIDTVIASPDIVAADAYGVTLFGAKAQDIDYIRSAAERGLGSLELDRLKIEEINVG
ncbi:MAG: DUF362 domain-containing protein [Anaerolineae bacterium]|nr:DUF362 domain-containing protein [Anaerolineae bacterium]